MTRHQSDNLSRRKFLGLTGASLLAGLAGTGMRWPGDSPSHLLQTVTLGSRVVLHKFDPAQTTATEAVQAAMLSATDLSWLQEGDSVFVKLASNSNLPPPSVTSPAVLEGVVQLLQDAGAGTVYVGDMSGVNFVRQTATGTVGSTRENMRENGLLAAAEATEAIIHCFEEVPFEEAYIPGIPAGDHHWGDDLQIAEILDRVDHIVNLPRLGKHVLAGASLGLKNAVGWISDYSRMVLHRDGATFHEKIAELNTIPQLADKMRLTLTLADKVLTTFGPDSGHHLALDYPLIVASEDVISHDQIALLTLLWARDRTPAAILAEDPYPGEANNLNWWTVRVFWGEEAAALYEDLPSFDDLADATTPTQINHAYALTETGRPETIAVIPGDLALDDDLVAMLTHNPALGVVLEETGADS